MKKRMIRTLLFVAVAAVMTTCFAFSSSALNATGNCGRYVTWNFNKDTGELVISGKGEMFDYDWNDYSPFRSESEIVSVVIENNVTSIGDDVFQYCHNLTSITIPESIEKISSTAFYKCEKLENISVADGNAYYTCDENGAVYSKDMKKLVLYPYGSKNQLYSIPDGVEIVGDYAMYGCTALKYLTIPGSVTDLSDTSFGECINLLNITVDENNETFSNDECGALFTKDKTVIIQYPIGNPRDSYSIPDGVEHICIRAFTNCQNPISIVIPDSMTGIDALSFFNCPGLVSITIPDSVKSIGDFAFEYCKNLSNITIPDSVTSIGVRAFSVCESLDDITIPDSVTSIKSGAFESCTNLKSIMIPDGVTDIESWTFRSCESLESITIPDGVTSIGAYAISNCPQLKSIEIPDSVQSIGSWAFLASGIQSITIPVGVKTINAGTFYGCGYLECITIPGSVTKIDTQAFDDCINLKDVYYYGNKPQWNEITIGTYNEDLHNATKHFLCCDHLDTTEFEAVAPTCANDGHKEGVYCNDCETWLSGHETIASPGHNPITVNEIAATCTDSGYSGDTMCSTCGEVLTKGSVLFSSGHDFDGSICKVCGFNRSENCSCNCHKGGIYSVFFRLFNFFQKLFGINKVCTCGVSH